MTAPETPSSTKTAVAEAKRINCIITVHGMGEPLPNSTLMPVAERIAQVVCPDIEGDTLTLGLLSGLTGIEGPDNPAIIPCIQLKGVSTDRMKGSLSPVFPLPGQSGDNLFFADIFWSGITQDTFPKVGDALPHWTECLLNRLHRKHEHLTGSKGTWWVLDMLFVLRQTVVFAEKVLALRSKSLRDVVFGKYLGDVQLYGEFAHCRGKSVRVFHDSMEKIHTYLTSNSAAPVQVEYTVIAHSLGSIMALDSLMLAHARTDDWEQPVDPKSKVVSSRGPGMEARQLPFPGYDNGKEYPKFKWIDSVKAFVTMGSPIDKFLTLWWYNYRYLLDIDWIRRRPAGRIKHYNFCDEQDPVGHRLDFARTAPAFKAVFGDDGQGGSEAKPQWNDLVYNHSPVPGAAHSSYWKDRSLFELIYDRVISKERPADIGREELEKFNPYHKGTYFLIILIHFYLIPILCIGACHFTLTWALTADGWNSIALANLAFLFSLWFGREILLLNLGWRQLLKLGSRHSPELPVKGHEERNSPLSRVWGHFMNNRNVHSSIARFSWPLLALTNWILCFKVLPANFGERSALEIIESAGVPVLMVTTFVLCVLFFALKKAFRVAAETGHHPAARMKDIVRFRMLEALSVGVALAPFLLSFFTPTRDAVNAVFASLPAWVPNLPLPTGRYLLYLSVLLQVSALAWVEVAYLNVWIRIRLAKGSHIQGRPMGWQVDFAEYARDPEDAKLIKELKVPPLDGVLEPSGLGTAKEKAGVH